MDDFDQTVKNIYAQIAQCLTYARWLPVGWNLNYVPFCLNGESPTFDVLHHVAMQGRRWLGDATVNGDEFLNSQTVRLQLIS